MKLKVEVEHGDIVNYSSDIIVLKYAREFHAADAAVAMTLADDQDKLKKFTPSIGKYTLVEGEGKIKANYALFLGVTSL